MVIQGGRFGVRKQHVATWHQGGLLFTEYLPNPTAKPVSHDGFTNLARDGHPELHPGFIPRQKNQGESASAIFEPSRPHLGELRRSGDRIHPPASPASVKRLDAAFPVADAPSAPRDRPGSTSSYGSHASWHASGCLVETFSSTRTPKSWLKTQVRFLDKVPS